MGDKQKTDSANPVGSQHEGKLSSRQPDYLKANQLNPPAAGAKVPAKDQGTK